jgi:hypothetical protein
MQSWQQLSHYLESALLTRWDELFRTGTVAWGLNSPIPTRRFFPDDRDMQAVAIARRDLSFRSATFAIWTPS